MALTSRHMRAEVVNREFDAAFNEVTEMKRKYKVALKKEVFLKFFSVLKLGGQCMIKLSHN